MIEFSISTDIVLVKDLLNCTTSELARAVGVGTATLERWMAGSSNPSASHMAAFYDYAFSKGLQLNQIKAQLHREQLESNGRVAIFHGAKADIVPPLSLQKSKPGNDFGRGFYCGESLEQSAMFVADRRESSLYIVGFDPTGLKRERFHVDEDWMLAIAWYRGGLTLYADHPRIQALRQRVEQADYIIAPIADNRMFEVIGDFADGVITDAQCRHSLSATSLGDQYVFVSPAALERVELVEHCFLSPTEKLRYLDAKRNHAKTGLDKAKVARRQFRGQGLYIEELLS